MELLAADHANPPARSGHARPRSVGLFGAAGDGSGMRTAGRRAVVAVAGAVLLVLVLQAFAGAAQIGISTDEPGHQARMNVWFSTGWYLPPEFMQGSQPRSDIETGRLHAYGAGFSAFGHAVAVIAGAEAPGHLAATTAAHTARGVAIALLGVAAALAVGYALWLMTSSRVIGLWAAAAVMALPLWTGYSMFAVKDVPAAAGWTMFTAGLVAALHPAGRRRTITVAVLCGVGVWFSFGVRTALWVPLAVMLATFVVLAGRRWRLAVPVVAGTVAGFVAVAALHFRHAASPIQWLVGSVALSGDFTWAGVTLTAGQLVSEKPPWWYLPAWTGGSVPILIGLMGLAGGGLAAAWFIRRRDSSGAVLWLQQAVMLPAVAMLAGSTMYAGLRQHLYVLPAIAALAALAAARLRTVRVVGPVVLILALLAPTIEQTVLFPYQFVYKNALAGPVNERWETDMHWVSAREGLARLPADAPVYCYSQPLLRIDGRLVDPRPFLTCREHVQVAPFLGDRADSPAVEQVWVLGRRYRGSPPAEGCTDAGSVTRRLRGEIVILSYVLRCDAVRGGE